jgi:hypothetical protein
VHRILFNGKTGQSIAEAVLVGMILLNIRMQRG